MLNRCQYGLLFLTSVLRIGEHTENVKHHGWHFYSILRKSPPSYFSPDFGLNAFSQRNESNRGRKSKCKSERFRRKVFANETFPRTFIFLIQARCYYDSYTQVFFCEKKFGRVSYYELKNVCKDRIKLRYCRREYCVVAQLLGFSGKYKNLKST